MITTTLNRIRVHSPCRPGWEKLLKHLGKTQADDEPLPFSVILDSNGLDDALWCCRAEPQHTSLWRHFAVDCAESVKYLMTDERSIAALTIARAHANGNSTDDELQNARDDASNAASDAARDDASNAASDASNAAASDASNVAASNAAASDAAWAAWAAASDAAWAAAWAARAAASDAAWAARAAASDAFSKNFRNIVDNNQ